MIIANPIYDVVFKRMMENERVAKFFIGTLLEQEVECVEVRPQELTFVHESKGITVFRLDFVATIKTATGEYQKILIEVQKARNLIDIQRFRNYLAEQYKQEDKIGGEDQSLPIVTIYILGFLLPEIEVACLKVDRVYRDLTSKAVINTKCDFVEKLTHTSYVVQVLRVDDRYQTLLDKLLSVFEQNHFQDGKKTTKLFTHPTDNEDIKILIDVLYHSAANEEQRKELDTEQEAWRTINAMLKESDAQKDKLLEEKDKALDEKDKALDEKDKALDEKEKALEEKDKELDEKEKALEEKNKALEESKKALEEKDNAHALLLKELAELKRKHAEK